MIGIRDYEIAFAFDVECEDILHGWELEQETAREQRQLAIMTGQTLTSALGGQPANDPNVRRW